MDMADRTRDNITRSKNFIQNCALVVVWMLLLASNVIIPQAIGAQQQQNKSSEDYKGSAAQQQQNKAEDTKGSTDPLTVNIISNRTRGVAPATFEFQANITGGTKPYTVSWNFDDSQESNKKTVVHTFDKAGKYNVTLTATDTDGQTASDSIITRILATHQNSNSNSKPAATDENSNSNSKPAATDENSNSNSKPAATDENSNSNSKPASLSALTNVPGLDGLPGIGKSKLGDILNPGSSNNNNNNPQKSPGSSNNTQQNPGSSNNNNHPQKSPGSSNNTQKSPQSGNAGQGGTDKFSIKELYPTAANGPTWYILEQKDPTTDGHFYYGMYRTTTISYLGSGVWEVHAESGTQKHGIRMHVDSPTGKWKNTEMTGYFKVTTGNDQVTMIARHGPSYHANGGCDAYGYYALTAVNGEVYFKKKLYHFNGGYTERVAQVQALNNILGKWIGMKFVVYDLNDGSVKLELWIDNGDMTNNWKKETELVDHGQLTVQGGSDCGRPGNYIIPEGTRVSYRVDNSVFDFKKLSVREIEQP